MNTQTRPPRVTDPDGATIEIFPLPSDEMSLEHLLRDLFEKHWDKITFGPLIQGAAWEIRAKSRNPSVGVMVGGKPFIDHPELVARVGADCTANDGRRAAIEAARLLNMLAHPV